MAGDPVRINGTLKHLGEVNYVATGPLENGITRRLGTVAVVAFGDRNHLILTPSLHQVKDSAIFPAVGLSLDELDIVAIKSRIHFRAYYQDVAGTIVEIDAPGLGPADLTELEYREHPQGSLPTEPTLMKMSDDRCIEIESVEELLSHIESESSLRGVAIQGLDLSSPTIESTLLSFPGRGAHFLGCSLSEKVESHIRSTGGTIFPDFKGLPFNAYRSSLYTVGELMEGYERGNRLSLESTVDGRIYTYFQKHRSNHRPIPIIPALSFRIHDHAVDNALFNLLYPKDAEPYKVLAVMGGHKMRRDDETYLAVATIASRLAKMGYLVTSGGGPGAMEATNLGGYFCEKSEQELEKIVETLSDSRFIRTSTISRKLTR